MSADRKPDIGSTLPKIKRWAAGEQSESATYPSSEAIFRRDVLALCDDYERIQEELIYLRAFERGAFG